MLAEAGWTVEEARQDLVYPSIPPQPYILCIVTARRADAPQRYLFYIFQMAPRRDKARIHWFEGAPGPHWFHPPTDCEKAPAARDAMSAAQLLER